MGTETLVWVAVVAAAGVISLLLGRLVATLLQILIFVALVLFTATRIPVLQKSACRFLSRNLPSTSALVCPTPKEILSVRAN